MEVLAGTSHRGARHTDASCTTVHPHAPTCLRPPTKSHWWQHGSGILRLAYTSSESWVPSASSARCNVSPKLVRLASTFSQRGLPVGSCPLTILSQQNFRRFCLKERIDMLQTARFVNNVDALYAHVLFPTWQPFDIHSYVPEVVLPSVAPKTPLGIFGAVIASH